MKVYTQQIERTRVNSAEAWLARVKHAWLVLAVLLVGVAALNLTTLMRLPTPHVDEGWNANRAWGFIHTGIPFGTLDAGVFEKYDGYWTFFPWLGTAIHAVSLFLFGPNLFAMRLVSTLFGLALLLAIYVIATRLYSAQIGLLAAALTSLSLPFVYSSHLGRHDIIVAAMGFGAVALYLTDDSPGLSIRSVLSGLLISLSIDVHFNGLIYIPVVLFLYLFDHRLAVIRLKRFWGFALGVGLGLGYFAAMHIMRYPQTFFTLFNIGNGSGRTPTPFALDPNVWLLSVGYIYNMLGLHTLLVLIALASLLWTRSASDKRVLVLFALLLLAFTMVIPGKRLFYNILIFPGVSLLEAAFLEKVLKLPWRGSPLAYARTAVVCGLVALPAAVSLALLATYDARDDYQSTISVIQQTIPPGSSIMGPQTYWFARPDERYLSWEQLIYYRRSAQGSNLEDAFRNLHPDYFIVDDFLSDAIIDAKTWPADKPLPFLYIPKADLDKLLTEHAHLEGRIQTAKFGDVRIYKLYWN